MTTDEGQTAFAEATGGAPSLSAPSFEPTISTEVVLDLYEEGLGRPVPHVSWPNGQLIEVIYAEMQNLYNGDTTPEQIVAKLDETLAG